MPIIESKKRNSILGSLALLIGLGAIALSVFDVPGLPSFSVGPWTLPFAVGLDAGVGVLALISLLLAGKSVRTGTEIPGAALLVAVAAGGIFYFRHRTPPAPPAPPSARQATPATAPATLTNLPKVPVNSPTKVPVPSSISNAANAAKNVTQQKVTALTQEQQLAALRDARAQFAAAQAKVIDSLKSDPAYIQAKARNDAADLQLRDARLSYRAGDPNLVTTSQAALAARDALNELVADAVAKDPAASAAKAKLDALTQPN
jgi:hypothetical protein